MISIAEFFRKGDTYMETIITQKASRTNPLAQNFQFLSLLRYAAPTIGTMLIFSLYTVIDGIFVARYAGPQALAAINLIFPAINLIIGISIMFASGGSAVVAKTLGEKHPQLASERFTMILCAATLLGFLLGTAGLLARETLVNWLGATPALKADCQAYLTPMLLFAPLMITKFLFDYFLVTAGRPSLGFLLSILSGLINAGLDYFLLAKCGMGISGAAWATVTAYTISSLAGLLCFKQPQALLRLRRFHWEPAILKKTITNGSSELVNQLSVAITTYLFNFFTLYYAGEAGIAAITIILYAELLLTGIYEGFTYGVAPIFSYYFGARNNRGIRHLMKLSLFFLAGGALFSFSAAQLLAPSLVEIFVPKSSVVAPMATSGLLLFSLSFLGCGFNLFTSGFFTALGNGSLSAFCSFSRNLAGISFFLLLLPMYLGLTGVWLAVPAADACMLLLSGRLLWNYYHAHKL